MHVFIYFITSLAPIIILITIMATIARAVRRRTIDERLKGQMQNNFDERLQREVKKIEGLKDLFANDIPSAQKEQLEKMPPSSLSFRCDSCGANMTVRGDLIECEFCGSKKRR